MQVICFLELGGTDLDTETKFSSQSQIKDFSFPNLALGLRNDYFMMQRTQQVILANGSYFPQVQYLPAPNF